jgi:ParB-like chromosome segregation protein Spo0J
MMSTGLLDSFLNPQPQNTDPAGPMHVEMLPISYIMPNPDNKKIYIVGDVERLKDDIKANGVRQPLEVIRWANGYKLIGGERRLTACKQLAAEGDERFTTVPCIIVESKGELEDKISLITANATARDLTDGERVAQYEALKDALTKKKQDGKLEGKVRDELCRILGISTGAAARLNIVASTENETIKERLRDGEIGFMQAVKDAQDYARFMGQASEDPEPEEPPKAAPAETLPKTVPKYPEWLLESAKEVCEIEWVKNAPDFTADALIKSKGDACGRSLTHGFVDFDRNKIRFWGYKKGDYSFTWAKFVRFCIEKGIAPEKHAAKSAAKPVEPAKPAANPAAPEEPKGHGTLYKLACKTLQDDAPWAMGWEDVQFQLAYYSQPLPGGATLWKRVDETRQDADQPCEDYAIILQDHSFYTCGWISYYAGMPDILTKFFELK